MNNDGHPLVDGLRRIRELGSEYDLPVRDPEQGGWINASSLFRDDDQRLQGFVSRFGRDFLGTDNRHLSASGFIIGYLTRVTFPLISQHVLERRVIDVSLDNVEFHIDGERFNGTALKSPRFTCLPDDPASNHPDADVVPDEAALYARLKERLFDSNFDLVIPALRRAAQASGNVSWNAVAASCAQVFYGLYESTEDTDKVVRHAERFFYDPSSPMYRQLRMGLIEHQGKTSYFARRAGCCLFYRVREENIYCAGCVLLSDDEQTVQFKRLMEYQP